MQAVRPRPREPSFPTVEQQQRGAPLTASLEVTDPVSMDTGTYIRWEGLHQETGLDIIFKTNEYSAMHPCHPFKKKKAAELAVSPTCCLALSSSNTAPPHPQA